MYINRMEEIYISESIRFQCIKMVIIISVYAQLTVYEIWQMRIIFTF